MGLEEFLRLRFVNDLAYGVWIVPSCPGNLQDGVVSSRQETTSLQITFFVSRFSCQLIYPHKFEVCKNVSKHFSSHP